MKNSRILCSGCNKPIHIDEFGGAIGFDGKQYFFHNNIVCLIAYVELEKEMTEAQQTKQEEE